MAGVDAYKQPFGKEPGTERLCTLISNVADDLRHLGDKPAGNGGHSENESSQVLVTAEVSRNGWSEDSHAADSNLTFFL